jgi:hypothetical protein
MQMSCEPDICHVLPVAMRWFQLPLLLLLALHHAVAFGQGHAEKNEWVSSLAVILFFPYNGLVNRL